MIENHEMGDNRVESENTACDIDIKNPHDSSNSNSEEDTNNSQLGDEEPIDNDEIAEVDVEPAEEDDEESNFNETTVENRYNKDNDLDVPEEWVYRTRSG